MDLVHPRYEQLLEIKVIVEHSPLNLKRMGFYFYIKLSFQLKLSEGHIMVNFIYSMSNVNLFLLINGLGLLFAFLCMFIIKFVLPKINETDTALIASSTICLLSTIVALVLGFILFFVFNNYSAADASVNKEAKEVASIYHYSFLLDELEKSSIKQTLRTYLREVIYSEWPVMRRGEIMVGKSYPIMNELLIKLNSLRDSTKPDIFNRYEHLYENISDLYDAHEDRMEMSRAALESEVWVIMVLVTMLIIIINCFIVLDVWIYTIICSFTSMIICSLLYLIVIFDHPFRGQFSVQPELLKNVLVQIDHN